MDAPPDGSEGSDSDSTDSEESVYSGLEEEEDTSNASEEVLTHCPNYIDVQKNYAFIDQALPSEHW